MVFSVDLRRQPVMRDRSFRPMRPLSGYTYSGTPNGMGRSRVERKRQRLVVRFSVWCQSEPDSIGKVGTLMQLLRRMTSVRCPRLELAFWEISFLTRKYDAHDLCSFSHVHSERINFLWPKRASEETGRVFWHS